MPDNRSLSLYFQRRARAFGFILLAGLVTLGAGCSRSPRKGETATSAASNRVVLLVNDEPIRQDEIDLQAKALIDRQIQQTPDLANDRKRLARMHPSIEQKAREVMIIKKVVAQAIRREGVSPTDEQVDAEMRSIDRYMQQGGASLEQYLRESGLTTEQVRQDVRQRLAERVLWDKLLGLKPPTDDEVRRFYDQNKERFTRPAEARVSMIELPWPQGSFKLPSRLERRELRKQTEALRERLVKGEDFAELAKTKSKGPQAAAGGDLGWINQGSTLPPAVIAAAFKQEIGAIGEPVESVDGFHLLLVKERRAAELIPFEQVREMAASEFLLSRQGAEVPAMLQRLRSQAKVTAP